MVSPDLLSPFSLFWELSSLCGAPLTRQIASMKVMVCCVFTALHWNSTKACNVCCPQSLFLLQQHQTTVSLCLPHCEGTPRLLLYGSLLYVPVGENIPVSYIGLFSKPSLGWLLVSTGICSVLRSPGPLLPVVPGLVSVALGMAVASGSQPHGRGYDDEMTWTSGGSSWV